MIAGARPCCGSTAACGESSPLDLYHVANASAADQASVVLMWQVTQGIFALIILNLTVEWRVYRLST